MFLLAHKGGFEAARGGELGVSDRVMLRVYYLIETDTVKDVKKCTIGDPH